MFRTIVYALTLLHLGPGLAFAVLAFGCDPSAPLLGDFCQRDSMGTFVAITLAVWVVGGLGYWLVRRRSVPGL